MKTQNLTQKSLPSCLPNLASIRAAQDTVYHYINPTPQYTWPLLNQALNLTIWVKHENQLPTGAFKVRGGINYLYHLHQQHPEVTRVISATRGNHGQSIAMAASLYNIESHIVVPQGNSVEKNQAMQALGAKLIIYGDDFHESRLHAAELAEQGYHLIPSFHEHLVAGVATYWLEFFIQHPDLDAIVVPIGLGSGVVAAIAAREALGLSTRIYGVVSSHANAYQQSFQQDRLIASPVSTSIADGVAVSTPDPQALKLMLSYLEDILDVNDQEICAAIKLYYRSLHQVAEGAAATPLAALCKYHHLFKGKKIGIPLTGSNIDTQALAEILSN